MTLKEDLSSIVITYNHLKTGKEITRKLRNDDLEVEERTSFTCPYDSTEMLHVVENGIDDNTCYYKCPACEEEFHISFYDNNEINQEWFNKYGENILKKRENTLLQLREESSSLEKFIKIAKATYVKNSLQEKADSQTP